MHTSKLSKWDGYSNAETFAIVLAITDSARHEAKVHKLAVSGNPEAPMLIKQYVTSKVRGCIGPDIPWADWEEIAEAFSLDYDLD